MTAKRKLLGVADRVQLIFGYVEDAMTRLSRIAQTYASGRTTEAVRVKREEEVRRELRRNIEQMVRGRGRDVLELVREFVVSESSADEDGRGNEYQSIITESLLAVIDAGFIAEDDPVAGERCPLCERDVSDHTRVDLYGEDTIVCMGSTRVGLVVGHPQALSRFTQAATVEAQRQFDELTKGSAARANAEDYAEIMRAVASLPAEQLDGIAYEGGPIAGVVAELMRRGPVLDKEKLHRVFEDGLRQGLWLDDQDDIEAAAHMLVNLLLGIFPVRGEYFSMEDVERVERARREPPPITVTIRHLNSKGEEVQPAAVTLAEDVRATPVIPFPPMVEGQTHWLIGNDYGLFYKIDAEGNVTRLENEYTTSEDAEAGLAVAVEPEPSSSE